MNNITETRPPATPETKKSTVPVTGAVVGTSMVVLMIELARSGSLEQYKDVLAPLIGWGPGLLIIAGFLWLAHTYAPPIIESNRATATALQRVADTVEHTANSQHDLVLAMQVNSDKLEQLRGTVADLQEHVQQLKEEQRHVLNS